MAAITQDSHTAHFFLQGVGGTGKTFLYTTLCHHFRAQDKIVLCVASSGIAAELLPDGQTSHSQFQIPLNIHQDSTTMIIGTSQAANLMRRAALIIWDEVSMQHKHCFEAVHQTLCDICGSTALFGGLPAILDRDFAQILPVVKNGTCASIVNACLQQSTLWLRLRKLVLQQNMKLQEDGANAEFFHWLSQLSYDPAMNGIISFSEYI